MTIGCSLDQTSAAAVLADPEESNPHHCADVFSPDIVPTFEVDISPDEWAAITAEYQSWKARQAQGLNLKPYHPVTFRYGNEVLGDASLKLQGNPSSSWTGNKMQFTVAFDQVDAGQRFHGLKKLLFHASPDEQTFLRERVALSYLRDLNLPAACENNSRLLVNGQFYGLYSNRESPDDKEFLKRVFPGAADGDLWKGGWTLDNNKTTSDPAHHDAFMTVTTAAAMSALADVDEALLDWAAESMVADNDGYWAVDHNFYLYEHPTRGFLWLPYDVDATFDFTPFDADPITWVPPWSQGWGLHQQLAMADPGLRARYVAAVAQALAGYDVDRLQNRIVRWQAQISASVAQDQHKPFSTDDQQLAVGRLDGYPWLRSKYVASWLACINSGVGQDADHDGYIWCQDCNDDDAAINPGATEICGNAIDENCNGRKDDCH